MCLCSKIKGPHKQIKLTMIKKMLRCVHASPGHIQMLKAHLRAFAPQYTRDQYLLPLGCLAIKIWRNGQSRLL